MGSGTEEEAADTIDVGVHNVEDRLQGRVLETINTCVVKPSTATPVEKEWLPLNNLDYLFMPFYTPLLCTFTLTVDQLHHFGSTAGVVQHLRDSLAQALVLFYPLAGRLVTKDGPPRIHCNDAGAVFTEASLDADMAELRTDDFLPVPLLSGLVAAGIDNYPVLPQMPAGLPALIIQVTHFKCGGITLAATWSHAVADGQAGLHFMKSWSELARGAQVSLLPDHRRDLVKPRDSPVPTNLVKAVAVSPDAQIIASKTKAAENDEPRKMSVETSPEASSEAENTKTEARETPSTTRITEFTKDEITKLRNAATDHPDPIMHLTRADCLSMHLWRTIAKARNLPRNARVRLWVLVEGRKKLNLPSGYFGNVLGMTPIITTVNELLNSPVADSAALIHTGIASITAEWFQGFVDLVQVTPLTEIFMPEPLGPDAECGVSYQVRFPYYDLDFGFGTPGASMRNTMGGWGGGVWDGLVFVLPSARGADSMIAMPNLTPEALRNFIAMAHDIPERTSCC